jgi:hypothetical protein
VQVTRKATVAVDEVVVEAEEAIEAVAAEVVAVARVMPARHRQLEPLLRRQQSEKL